MTLTLSTADVLRLQAALGTLVSPLDHPSIDAWRTAAFETVRVLLGADKGFHMLPMADESLVVGPEVDSDGYVAWQTYYHKQDTGFVQRRRELGLEVCNWSMVYDLGTLRRTEIYNDFSAHYGFLDPVSVSLDLTPDGPPAAIVLYHERADQPEFGERGLDLLRLLLPAFKAGARTCLRLARHRAELARLVDRSGQCLLVCDLSGRVLHETPALQQLLGSDGEATRLRQAMMPTVHALATLVRPRKSGGPADQSLARCAVAAERETRTATARYRIGGAVLGEALFATDPVVLVTLARLAARAPSDDELRRQFGLTPRELAVARLLAAGRTNTEIARALAIRPRTAEQHTARVLGKLGVHSRGAAAALVQGIRQGMSS